jgi:hypothetical protein
MERKDLKYRPIMLKSELYDLMEKRRAELGLRTFTDLIIYLLNK